MGARRRPDEGGGAGGDDRHAGRRQRHEDEGDAGARGAAATLPSIRRTWGAISTTKPAGKAASSPRVAGSPMTPPPRAPSERADVPAHEHGQPGRPERPHPVAPVGLGHGHRRRLVEHELGGDEAAPPRTPDVGRQHQPVGAVAGGQQQRAGRGRPAALPPAPIDADGGELRRAGEHQQRQRARLGHRQAAGHRQHAERHAEDADGDAQDDGGGDRRPAAPPLKGRWRPARARRAAAA